MIRIKTSHAQYTRVSLTKTALRHTREMGGERTHGKLAPYQLVKEFGTAL